MDKILSASKRALDDSQASTSTQASMVPKIKSRKYSQEYCASFAHKCLPQTS